ncbi:MAG: Asp-tRNA(Asn)/Glu-tRNA(Gln) amidotransferase GatCAB subunit B, partial [Thaumarchaeota archaeon]|nr:Asp-tRNA(Asn)/Glu-tRNA(Gln) amidotransferase GatCAB subunit B [Nitrososphaerota archaeon]
IIFNKITRNAAKIALQEIIKTGKQLSEIISSLDLGHVDDQLSLSKIVEEVFSEEQKAVSEAKNNPDAINFLVGKIMKKTKGKANPSITIDLVKKRLDDYV